MEIRSFNDGWKYSKGVASPFDAVSGKTKKCIPVVLPHDAMIAEERDADCVSGCQSGFYPAKSYTYEKTFDVPSDWENKQVYLEFEGVMKCASVFVNGSFAVSNRNGYLQFFVNLNPYLVYGEKNTIRVITENTELSSRWYTGSGIYRNVNLHIGGEINIPPESVKIKTEYVEDGYAYLSAEILLNNAAKKTQTVTVDCKVIDNHGKVVSSGINRLTIKENSNAKTYMKLSVDSPELWSDETPDLYELSVTVLSGDGICDTAKQRFGIRTLKLDSRGGLRVNGKSVKLRGACIHHDNGIIGATTLYSAEKYRAKKLKDAGFNAIRSSHNPMSKAMLDACDELGIYVMDELSDVWNEPKNSNDFSFEFVDAWKSDCERLVAKDYNHPCVIIYCLGNEIPDLAHDGGKMLNRELYAHMKALDGTRYVTNAINGVLAAMGCMHLFASNAEKMAEQYKQEAVNSENDCDASGIEKMNAIMGGAQQAMMDAFAVSPILTECMEETSCALDIVGLNYLTARHELEHKLNPERIIVGSETYPPEIARLWKIVENNNHVIGDFTWTGYDYIGEAGIGIYHYNSEKTEQGWYPDRLAYTGDININGYRRPVSYLREIAYGIRKIPFIAVCRPEHIGQKCDMNNWKYYDAIDSWTYPGYEGESIPVIVMSASDEVELVLNGKRLGKKQTGKDNGFTAIFEVPYEPGELIANGYTAGKPVGSFSLTTANKVTKLLAEISADCISSGGDVCFITVDLTDANGRFNMSECKKISVKVEGEGYLCGFGSANPSDVGNYFDVMRNTFDGRVSAAVRSGENKGKIKVTFSAEGVESATVTIKVL